MSLGARATKGGAKAGKEKGADKGKTDKPQPKEKVKPQATTEQLRMAHMIDRKNDDASDVRRMVLELMEMTRRTEEEVCSALHDSDNDIMAACNLLLEDTHRIQGEWQTSEKKKKKAGGGAAGGAAGNGECEPPPRAARSRSGPRPPGRGEGEGARGRGAARRGGRGGLRGARGGRRGAGGRRPRPPVWDDAGQENGGNPGDAFPTTEDWDNEEWSGSLDETKVFTPSASAQNAVAEPDVASNAQEDWETPEPANGPSESHIPTYTYHSAHTTPPADKLMERAATAASTAGTTGALPAPPLVPDAYRHHQPMGMSGSLSAAQSQYLSQLTARSEAAYGAPAYYQPADAARKPARARLPPPSKLTARSEAAYGAPAYYQPADAARKPARARLPPPSKIPSSAVEMPGGEAALLLDVQFGALEDTPLGDAPSLGDAHKQHSQAPTPTASVAAPEPATHTPPSEPQPVYPASNNTTMLTESMSSAEAASQPPPAEPVASNSTSSLEKQLSAGMKQLSVSSVTNVSASAAPPAAAAAPMSASSAASASAADPPAHYTAQHHRPKQATTGGSNVYAPHGVTHPPAPVYPANVYAVTQVNSTNAPVSGGGGLAAYPSVTLTQYQPVLNSYQTSSSATVYGGSALYTGGVTAPYTYQPPHKLHKDQTQYESAVASSNSLTSTSTTQTSTAKVATTTVSGGVASGGAASTGAAYAGALYGAGGYAYDEQCMRAPHHMGGYYEMGYGVSGAREGTFGLGAGERFSRADAASPQQVPPAALPPGYAYFYQPPPTTYQYGVYPTYGGGSNVGGASGVGGVSGGGGKLSTYAPQQPPYEAQDSYKPGGGYTGSASKAGGGAAPDLANPMYAKTHVALNKVNSYEKAAFHSGTPPPFGGASHLYIPAPPHHHHPPHHHQMDGRVNSSHNRRAESGAGGARGGAGSKPAASKPSYSQSYWAPN